MKKVFRLITTLFLIVSLNSCTLNNSNNIEEPKGNEPVTIQQANACGFHPVGGYFYSLDEVVSFYSVYKNKNNGSPVIIYAENDLFQFEKYELAGMTHERPDINKGFDFVYDHIILRSFYKINMTNEQDESFQFDVHLLSYFIDSNAEIEELEFILTENSDYIATFSIEYQDAVIGKLYISTKVKYSGNFTSIADLIIEELIMVGKYEE